MININNLNKNYGKQKVLNNLNIQFNENKIYGIVGYNGAGKSTLFNCITGITSFEGTMQIDKDIQIGYLPTDLYMYPKITGLEYIEFCLSARKLKLDKARLDDWNKLIQLPLDKYAQEYSTGMKKKLAILALILQSNDIIMLDEPFNGLDLSSNMILTDIILAMKKANKTVIISSHILQPLKEICDTIDVLDKGEIIRYSNDKFNLIDNYFRQQRNNKLETELLNTL